MSQTEPGGSPPTWEDFIGRHGVGDLVDGQMAKVLPLGAFIGLRGGSAGSSSARTGRSSGRGSR